MKYLTTILLLLTVSLYAQTSGQFELRKRTATGFTAYGLTPENGKVIGFTAGVPAMISVSTGSGSGDALIGDPLSQFAATTSAQLRGVLSDESGTGLFLTTTGSGASLTGITAGQISGLGSLATQSGTFSGTSSGTNTGDQNLSSYLTSATAASTYAPLASPSFTGQIVADGDIQGRVAGVTRYSDGMVRFFGGANASPWHGGVGGSLLLQGADADGQHGGNGGSLNMYGTAGQNAGSITTIAGGSLTMGTADLSGGSVAGTILTTAGSGASLTSLNADNISSGTVAAARLGSGSSITTKYLRGDNTWQTISGGGDALTSGTLAQFAATTSAQLTGILSDESGTGVILTTTGSAANLTNFPTLNQNTSGNAATVTTNANLTGPVTSVGNATAIANGAISNAMLANGAVANLSGTNTGDQSLAAYLTSATASSTYQPLDSDLTSIAALVTTTAGRALLDDADAAAQRTTLGLGTLATQSATITDYLTTASAASTYQPLDADLTDLADGSLTGTLVAAATTSARGSVELATDGETAASVAVQGSDARLVSATKVEIGIALSDETSDNTASSTVPKVTFRMPFAMTITSLRCSLTKSSTGAILIVDMHEAGTTVMTTNKLSVDASETTSTTAATAHTLTDTALADDALIELFIDQVGTTTDNTGEGVKVWIIGTR